jgi:hypothetical protein
MPAKIVARGLRKAAADRRSGGTGAMCLHCALRTAVYAATCAKVRGALTMPERARRCVAPWPCPGNVRGRALAPWPCPRAPAYDGCC